MAEEPEPGAGAEQPAADPGVAELANEFFDSDDSAQAESGAEGQGEQPAGEPPAVAQPPEEQPRGRREPPAAPQQPEPRYTVRGREYSAAEIAANPHLLQDLVGTYDRYPQLQQKHEAALQMLRGQPPPQGQQPPQGQPQPQAPQPISPEAIVAHFGAEASELERQGYFDEGLTEAAPKLMANLVGYRKVIEDAAARLARVEQFLNAGMRQQEQMTHQQQVTYVVNELDAGIDHVAEAAPTFGPLKDPAVREQFRQFVINDLNPEAKQVVGEAGRQFMERAAYAFFGPAIAQSIQQQAAAHRSRRQFQRQNAQGDAGSSRPGQVATDEWGEELASFAGVPAALTG